MRRRFGLLVAVAVAAAGLPLLLTSPAQATAYRYWSYWHGVSGSWQFSQVGAATWRVHDGSVEAWRFAVSPGTAKGLPPRLSAARAFDQLCGDTDAREGTARVALVLDFGTGADAPPGDEPPATSLQGSCLQVADGANGFAVLDKAGVTVRDKSGMVCALAGYPSVGCGEAVTDPTPTPTPTSTRTTKPTRSPKPSTGPTRTAGPSRPPGSSPSSSPPLSSSPPSTPRATATPTGTSAVAPPVASSSTAPSAPPTASPSPPSSPDDPDPSPSLVAIQASGSDGSEDSGGSPWPAVAVAVVVAVLGAGAYLFRRRAA